MEKQKVLSIIIVVLILIFSAFTVLLFTLNLSSNSAPTIDTGNYLASEPMVTKPTETATKQELALEPDVMVGENDLPLAEERSSSQLYGEKLLRAAPGELQRTTEHVAQVKSGDTVSAITLSQWGNAYLWPDLYTYNSWRSDNPDLIYPGERIEVPNHLGRGHRYNDAEIASLTASYLEVYHLYRNQGAKANSSKWYTLYSATRIMPDFLEKNRDHINADDIIMAQKHMKESARLE